MAMAATAVSAQKDVLVPEESEMPEVVFKCVYMDALPTVTIGTILKWCSNSQYALQVPGSAFGASVFRTSSMEILVAPEQWRAICGQRTLIRVRPVISRVGSTSWAVRMAIEAVEDGLPLARVEFIKVQVSFEDLTKPIPILGITEMKTMVRPDAVAEVYSPKPAQSPPPSSAFVWRTQVRESDCDQLEHVNNSVYGLLLEDARSAARAAGALPLKLASALEPSGYPRAVVVEFLGQPHRGESLDVAVWPCPEDDRRLNFEFRIFETGKVACKVAMICGREPLREGESAGPFAGSSMARPGSKL